MCAYAQNKRASRKENFDPRSRFRFSAVRFGGAPLFAPEAREEGSQVQAAVRPRSAWIM